MQCPRLPIAVSLVLTLIVPISAAHSAVVLDRQAAVSALVSELGLGGTSMAWCPHQDYGFGAGFEGVLPAGTTIRPVHLDTQPFPGNVARLTQEMYFFFVDDQPNSGFTHRVRYVYVDATAAAPTLAGGTIHVQEQGWWPVIQRPTFPAEELFGAMTRISTLPPGYSNADGLVFSLLPPPLPSVSTPPSFKPVLPGLTSNANNCAIVASGVPTNSASIADRGLHGSAENMNRELRNRGVPAARIQNKRNASKQDLRDAVTALCNASPPCDKIYLSISTHGSKGSLQLGPDGSVPADTLCDILKPLGAKGVPVCVLIEACHSGSLVSTLRPKFPTGVFITSCGADTTCWTDVIQDSTGAVIDTSGFFGWAFIQCWNSPAANTNGDTVTTWDEAYKWICAGDNGKVRWGGSQWDVKTLGPALTGLPDKTVNWQAVSGVWYVDIYRDTDQDGKYDEHDWGRDDDCDGNLDVLYLNNDIDEDGKNERTVCIRDVNDDGTPDTRYVFDDPNDDGNTDNITCSTWNGSGWTQIAQAPPRPGNFAINPSSGPRSGDQPFQIQGDGSTQWFNPSLEVFVGSHAKNVQLVNPGLIEGVTNGYTLGPVNVIVVDFNISSPSYGFVEVPLAFDHQPHLFVETVDPSFGHCGVPIQIEILGLGFEPASQVFLGPDAVPFAYDAYDRLTAVLPPNCGVTLPLTVINPDGSQATLENALQYLPAPDTTPPDIFCPPDLQLTAGPDDLARTPAGYTAEAFDPSGPAVFPTGGPGPVTVYRNHIGALPLGSNPVDFEAVDGAGNRTTCTSTVDVDQSGSAGPPPGAHFGLAGSFPNPFASATTIRFSLEEAASVRLSVFDAQGRRVNRLVDGLRAPGPHEIAWDGRGAEGHPLPSGVYFLKLQAGDRTATRQALILR